MKFLLSFILLSILFSCDNLFKENSKSNQQQNNIEIENKTKIVEKQKKIDSNILCNSKKYSNELKFLDEGNKNDEENGTVEIDLEKELLKDKNLSDEKRKEIEENIKKRKNKIKTEKEICNNCIEVHTSSGFFITNYKELPYHNLKGKTMLLMYDDNKLNKHIEDIDNNKEKVKCFLGLGDYNGIYLSNIDLKFIKKLGNFIPNNFNNLEILLNSKQVNNELFLSLLDKKINNLKFNIYGLEKNHNFEISKLITDKILTKKSNIELNIQNNSGKIKFEDNNFLRDTKDKKNITILLK